MSKLVPTPMFAKMILTALVLGASSSLFAQKLTQLASDNPANFEAERKLIQRATSCSWKSGAREYAAAKASPEAQNYLLRYSDLIDRPLPESKVCVGKIVCSIPDTISGLETEFQTGSEVVCAFKESKASCDPKECFLKTTAYKENMAAEDHQMALERSQQQSNDSSSETGRD